MSARLVGRCRPIMCGKQTGTMSPRITARRVAIRGGSITPARRATSVMRASPGGDIYTTTHTFNTASVLERMRRSSQREPMPRKAIGSGKTLVERGDDNEDLLHPPAQ